MKDFTFVGIANNAKGLSMNVLDQEAITKNRKDIPINKGEFYLFYPLKKQIVISFGENLHGRLGSTGQFTGAKMSLSTKDIKPS